MNRRKFLGLLGGAVGAAGAALAGGLSLFKDKKAKASDVDDLFFDDVEIHCEEGELWPNDLPIGSLWTNPSTGSTYIKVGDDSWELQPCVSGPLCEPSKKSNTKIWVGHGNRNDFESGANWSDGTPPENGDSLVFQSDSYPPFGGPCIDIPDRITELDDVVFDMPNGHLDVGGSSECTIKNLYVKNGTVGEVVGLPDEVFPLKESQFALIPDALVKKPDDVFGVDYADYLDRAKYEFISKSLDTGRKLNG